MALSPRRREAPRGRYSPDLRPVRVAPLVLALALLLGWGIHQLADHYFTRAAAEQDPPRPADVNDVLKATVTVLTLIGAVLAGLYAYRKQLLAEGDAHRADASQLADRYTTVAEQLGHERAAVRLAGVYALARLADDWEEQRQVCVDLLCAYLRMPYQPDPAHADHRAGEREVRLTVLRVLRDHLREPDSPDSWCDHDFDLTGALFDGGDLSHSHFRGSADFGGATFTGGTVHFGWVVVDGGGVLNFGDTRISGGATVDVREARFRESGKVFFHRAVLDHGTVTFREAMFTGASTVNFRHATFAEGSGLGYTGTRFRDSTAQFGEAAFDGGTVDFTGARFTGGGIDFAGAARDGGTVRFTDAVFDGTDSDWGVFPAPTGT
ncbi:pentapeptide repeat-containing protein [Streptomyces sp. NPDC002701]|uniref:pentapeptide repeat-containing protein n=1 Tax=Streptomyces sp. NPDC002701 TaxID=3364661 RepID=UPI0036AC5AC6